MLPIRRLLMAGLVLVGTGCLIGCSDNGSDQDSLAPLPQSTSLRLQQITANLSSPVFMTAPANDSSRLFIVEQDGLIRIFDVTTGSLLAPPFLDINGLTSSGGEEGLLGMAFDPQYAINRQLYVFYTNNAGNIVIARYLRNATNANLADSLATTLLTVAHPKRGLFSDGRVCVPGIRQAGLARHVFLCRFLRGICEEFPLSERSTHRANRMAVTQSTGRVCDEFC